MPVTLHSDLKVYNPQTQAGYVETITQNIDVLNASSQGTISMTSKRNKGHMTLEAFFKNTADLVSHRDINSTGAAAAKKLSQGEMVDIKLNRKIGPLDATEDSLFKAGFDLEVAQFVVGQMSAMHVTQNHVHTALLCLTTALAAQPNLFVDISEEATPTIHSDALVRGISQLGDRAGRIVCWVMHSGAFFKLVREQIAQKLTGISDLVLATANPVTLNRPTLITDDPALVVTEGTGAGAATEYLTLGLVEGACQMEESEGERIYFDRITGLENIVWRTQGEYAFNIGMKGFAWDVASGGINPTDTALGTAANWDSIMASHKDLPGVLIRHR
jgi:hypothetical protein